MNVRLVAITDPQVVGDDLDFLSPEEFIVYTARVSNPSNQTNTETAPKLLRYLIDHKHWSPFEMVDMTLEIETSRAIAAQILRHRSFSFQEFSQRYADVSELGFEDVEPRRQDLKNRQNSVDDLPDGLREAFRFKQRETNRRALENYQWALSAGVAKEQARMFLPLSTTTRLYMKGSVRSWLHYFEARLDPGAQKEHRDVARAAWDIFSYEFPVTADVSKEGKSWGF